MCFFLFSFTSACVVGISNSEKRFLPLFLPFNRNPIPALFSLSLAPASDSAVAFPPLAAPCLSGEKSASISMRFSTRAARKNGRIYKLIRDSGRCGALWQGGRRQCWRRATATSVWCFDKDLSELLAATIAADVVPCIGVGLARTAGSTPAPAKRRRMTYGWKRYCIIHLFCKPISGRERGSSGVSERGTLPRLMEKSSIWRRWIVQMKSTVCTSEWFSD